MVESVLFTFDSEAERAIFCQELDKLANERPAGDEGGDIVAKAMLSPRFNPIVVEETERPTALYVGGNKVANGPLSEMLARFKQEAVQHSASISIKEVDRTGRTVTIHSRTNMNKR